MKFSVKAGDPQKQRADCIIAGVTPSRQLVNLSAKSDKTLKSYFSQILKQGDCDGKIGQTLLLHPPTESTRWLLVGLGADADRKDKAFRDIIEHAMHALNKTQTHIALFDLTEIEVIHRDIAWKIQQAVLTIAADIYQFEDLKSQKAPPVSALKEMIFSVSPSDLKRAQQALDEAIATAEAITFTKNLANLPANICNPSYLAQEAKKLAKKYPAIKTKVLEEKEMAALGMGSLLSVTNGSTSEAKLITLEYKPKKSPAQPIVFVGKGITFDTGGNSIKSGAGMIGMKYDMCGAASVLGILQAVAALALPLHIVGVIPTCENMPGPNATRPDDIVTSMSGLTIEILNTDAEGRLILADALTYSERYKPEVVIDMATLTGGCALALGPYASGLMSNHPPLAQALLAAGTLSGDRAWELPLWDEYHDALKSDFADVANIPPHDIGAKTIVAGCFLAKFTKNFHWAHLDIANTATYHGGPKRGATGRPISLIMTYLLNKTG